MLKGTVPWDFPPSFLSSTNLTWGPDEQAKWFLITDTCLWRFPVILLTLQYQLQCGVRLRHVRLHRRDRYILNLIWLPGVIDTAESKSAAQLALQSQIVRWICIPRDIQQFYWFCGINHTAVSAQKMSSLHSWLNCITNLIWLCGGISQWHRRFR